MGIARTQFVILIMAFFTQIWILIFLLGLHTYVCDGAKGCSMTAAQGGCTNPADTHCRLRYDTGKSKWGLEGPAGVNAGCVLNKPDDITVDKCGGKGDGVRCYVAGEAPGTALDIAGKCTDSATCVAPRAITASCDGLKVCQGDSPKCKAVKKQSTMKRAAAAAKKYSWPAVPNDAPGCVYEAKSGCQTTENPKSCYVPVGSLSTEAVVSTTCGTCFDDLNVPAAESKCDGTNKCKVADPVCAFALFEGKEGWHPNGTNHGCVTKGKNVVGTCTGTNFCILQPKNGAIDSSVCTAQCPSAQKQKPAEVPDPSPSGPTSSGSSLCYRTILLVIISLLYI